MGSTVAGGIFKAFGQGFAGFSQAGMYNYQAGIAQLQAQIAKQNASYALTVGGENQMRTGLAQRNQLGQIRAAQGASNLDVGGGSNKLVQQGQHEIALMDQNQVLSNAARQAYGYETEAATDTAKAGLFKSAATKTMIATPINVAASLISTGGSVADKWYQGQSTGIYSADSSSDYSGPYAPDDI